MITLTQTTTTLETIVKKGLFTRCTDGPTLTTVTLRTYDPVKELYSLGWIDDQARLFPTLEQVGEATYDKHDRPCYTFVTDRVLVGTGGLNADGKRVYKALRRLFNAHPATTRTGIAPLHDAVMDAAELTEAERESVCSLINQAGNFAHDPRFEISPRNVGSRADGSLCLFDVVFCGRARADAVKRPFKF
jgi:hypothetical protein